MKTLVAAGAIFSTALLSPALAADLPVKAKPAPAMSDWTGFYAGVNIGYGWGNRDVSFTPNDDATRLWSVFDGIPPPASFKTSGALGGLQLGYNRQLSSWLIGLETDFDWSGLRGSGTSSGVMPPVPIPGPYSAPFDERIDWFGTVRARLGYLPTDTLLTYGTGGLAYGQVRRSGSYVNKSTTSFTASGFPDNTDFMCASGATCFSGSSSEVAAGWTVGGGFEYAVGERMTLKAEYLYVNLAAKTLTEAALAVFIPGDTPASINVNAGRATFSVARVGLNYRF
jgi:outer membrane immunogenic protein